jgi:hypothetical protein
METAMNRRSYLLPLFSWFVYFAVKSNFLVLAQSRSVMASPPSLRFVAASRTWSNHC